MIKGNCAQSVVPRHGEELNSGWQGCAALRTACSFHGTYSKALCCNLLLQTLECYQTCSHAHLACFLFERNQQFVGSARIVGLCFYNWLL